MGIFPPVIRVGQFDEQDFSDIEQQLIAEKPLSSIKLQIPIERKKKRSIKFIDEIKEEMSEELQTHQSKDDIA